MFLFLLLVAPAIAYYNKDGQDTVVISVPFKDDDYYKSRYDTILSFHANLTKILHDNGVNVIVSCGYDACDDLLKKGVNKEAIWRAGIPGIWMRDLTRAAGPGKKGQPGFLYQPNYIPKKSDSKEMQDTFDQQCKKAGLKFKDRYQIVADTGNVVDNFKDKAVLTSRVIKEAGKYAYPDYTEENRDEMEAEFERMLGYEKVCIIPEIHGDTTGHSDGMVSWISEQTLAYSKFDPYLKDVRGNYIAETMHSELKRCFGESIKYVEVPYTYPNISTRGEKGGSGFTSACGTHVNALFTGTKLFVPTFHQDQASVKEGLTAEVDKAGVDAIMKGKDDYVEVIKVPVPKQVCELGGNVRCLSYLLDYDNGAQLAYHVRSHSEKPMQE